jgi:hypothetical protein
MNKETAIRKTFWELDTGASILSLYLSTTSHIIFRKTVNGNCKIQEEYATIDEFYDSLVHSQLTKIEYNTIFDYLELTTLRTKI